MSAESPEVSPVSQRPAHVIIGILVNVLTVLAIAVTARLVVEFFGQLAAQQWGKAIIALTNPVVIPFGVDVIKTPYGGVFDVDAALMVGVYLGAEWLLSGMRIR